MGGGGGGGWGGWGGGGGGGGWGGGVGGWGGGEGGGGGGGGGGWGGGGGGVGGGGGGGGGYFEDRLIIEVDNEESLFELSPNFNALIKAKGRGIAVTTKSSASDVDFVSRYFAPWVGVNEDPVTGSAQCALAEYWKGKLNKESFNVYQASRRGGYLGLRLVGDRVKIQGTAYTVISGTLNLSKLKRFEKS